MADSVHHIGAQPYVLCSCPVCGTLYLIPQAIKDAAIRLRNDGHKPRTIYCPDGCQWHYAALSNRELDKTAKARIEELESQLKDYQDKLEAAERLNRQLGVNVVPLPKKA